MIDQKTANKRTGKILFITDYRATAIVHTLEHEPRVEVWIILGRIIVGKAIQAAASTPPPATNVRTLLNRFENVFRLIRYLGKTTPRSLLMKRASTNWNPIAGFAVVLMLASQPLAQSSAKGKPQKPDQTKAESQTAKRVSFVKAVVIDDRFSALRREPSLQSEVIHRLRLGHTVYVIHQDNFETSHSAFCRIAASRRTRGWIYRTAIAVQGRAGEDQRIMKLIDGTSDGLDRIALCRILIERFGQSALVPRALLRMGEEGERAAETLTQRARKRITEAAAAGASSSLRDFYLNDSTLDRYSKLRIVFEFNEQTREYIYDGRAYRDLLSRSPHSEEALLARQRLGRVKDKTARRQ